MKTYRSRDNPLLLQIAQVCVAWVVLGLLVAIVALSTSGTGALAGDQTVNPSAEAVERAVVEAEAQANLIRPVMLEQP